jgi:hypothetical protein
MIKEHKCHANNPKVIKRLKVHGNATAEIDTRKTEDLRGQIAGEALRRWKTSAPTLSSRCWRGHALRARSRIKHSKYCYDAASGKL